MQARPQTYYPPVSSSQVAGWQSHATTSSLKSILFYLNKKKKLYHKYIPKMPPQTLKKLSFSSLQQIGKCQKNNFQPVYTPRLVFIP